MNTDKKVVRPPPPLDRKKVLPQLVTHADAFSLMLYDKGRREMPVMAFLEKEGKLPGMPAVLADTAFSLWAHTRGVKAEVSQDRRYWRDTLGQAIKTPAYQGLAAKTRSDWLLATLGTAQVVTEMLHLIPTEDEKKLQEITKAQAKADALEQEAKNAEAQAEAFEQILAKMTAQAQVDDGSESGAGQPGQPGTGTPTGQGSPGNGTPSMGMTAAQAQQLASAIAQAETARENAEYAKMEVEDLTNALLGKPGSVDAEKKLTELRRLGIGALKKATEKVEEVSETINAWGLDPGELNEMPVPEALALLEKMRKNASFKEFAQLLGRMRTMAKAKAKCQGKGDSRRIPRQETGRDIARATTSELANYAAGGALKTAMFGRWANGTLRVNAAEIKNDPKGRGPVVVCEDSSGSMSEARRQWAKAVSLALATYARVQNRGYGWIMFDSCVQQAKSYIGGRVPAKDLLEIAEATSGGGTDFEAPLRRAMKMIDAGNLAKADIVFITDGECALGEKFLKEFLAWKKTKEVTVVGVIVDSSASDATVRAFADKVERASGFTVEEAEKTVFAHL